MEKRYQVFLSSTYTDLQEERQKVMQTLMEMDCIPAGMELFPAADDEQLEFIKRVIDDSDYYILIIGGRYGSLTAEGISFTEKEYDYAKSKEIPVLVFIHGSPENISVGKSDIDPLIKEKLDSFRHKVSSNRLIKHWEKPDELPGLVSLSLNKAIKTYPAIGWVRANSVSNDELLQDINKLRKENEVMRNSLAQIDVGLNKIKDIAGLDEFFEGKISYRFRLFPNAVSEKKVTVFKITWGNIFAHIAPELISYQHDHFVEKFLRDFIFKNTSIEDKHVSDICLLHDDYQTIKIQLQALNLINIKYLQSKSGEMGLFWTLTSQGQRVMFELRTVKKKVENNDSK